MSRRKTLANNLLASSNWAPIRLANAKITKVQFYDINVILENYLKYR